MARGKGGAKHGLNAEFTALSLIGAYHPASSSTCPTPALYVFNVHQKNNSKNVEISIVCSINGMVL